MKKVVFILILISQVTGFSQTSITFFHYNDLHAHLISHKDLVRSGDHCGIDNSASLAIGYRGGLARLKTLVDSLKAQYPNNVLMNIGDTYHGGVEAAYTSGNAIVDPVNSIGFDVGVPGNWDFAYGPGVFRKRYVPSGPFPQILNNFLPPYPIESPSFLYIAANLTYNTLGPLDNSPDGGNVLPPTSIKNIGGVPVGFIGLTSDIVPTMYAQLATGFTFLQGENNYINLINTLSTELRNNGALVVVVMSELGIHKDYQLANKINNGSVNVFFSAHTHELTYEPLITQSGAIVVESGNDGYLGQLNIIVNQDESVVLEEWNIIPITSTISENPMVKSIIDAKRSTFLTNNPNMQDPMGTSSQELHRPITDTIGFSKITLTRINALESSFNNSFTDIMRQYSGSEVAITPGFRFDSPTGKPGSMQEGNIVAVGEITVEDVYRFFPVFYTLATAKVEVQNLTLITEKLLKNVYSTDAFEQGGGWVDGFSGVKMDINLNNTDYSKVTAITKFDGTALGSSDTLTIIGCQRPFEAADIICSHSGFTDKQDFTNAATSQAWTPIQLLENYLMTDSIQDPNRNTFTELGNWDTYPEYPWVQPLPFSANCAPLSVNERSSELTNNSIVYPNPVSNSFSHNINSEIGLIEVYSMQGRLIKSFQNVAPGQKMVVNQIAPGSYLIVFKSKGIVQEKTIVVFQ